MKPVARLQNFSRREPCVTILIPAIIPHTGTLRRCSHSVYWPQGDEIAFYCGMCNPLGAFPDVRGEIVLPGTRAPRCLDDAGRLYANKRDPNACPNCHSYIHVILSETTDHETGERLATWRCADCDTVYEHVNRPRIPGEYISPFDRAGAAA